MVLIPTVIERNSGSDHVYDLYSRLLKMRIIVVTGEIEDNMASSICAQLLYLSSLNNDEIQMYIHSPGGSVSAGLAILDIMNHIESPVSTIGMGICASMAAILLSNGAKGKRYILKNCEVMIHQPIGETRGQSTDMEIATNHMIKTRNTLYQILADNCNKEFSAIQKDCDRDNYMDAQTALNYGIIDKII